MFTENGSKQEVSDGKLTPCRAERQGDRVPSGSVRSKWVIGKRIWKRCLNGEFGD